MRQVLYDPNKSKRNCFLVALSFLITLGASVALFYIFFFKIRNSDADRTSINIGQWNLIGGIITPEDDVSANCGWDVDISSDGSVVVIGCPFANDFYGSTYLYRLDENEVKVEEEDDKEVGGKGDDSNGMNSGSAWSQIGTWKGENSGDLHGSSVSIATNNPAVVAIGEPNFGQHGRVIVYKNDEGSFNQLGDAIEGQHDLEHFGYSIGLSGSGNRIVVGASTSKYVHVIDFDGSHWERSIDPIETKSSVTGVCLSEDGGTVGFGSILGAKLYDVKNDNRQTTTSYKDTFSHIISTSANGEVFAVGDWGYDCIGKKSCGRVRVFSTSSDDAVQIGNNIFGTSEFNSCGFSLDLSADGRTIVIGCNQKKVMIATLKDSDSPKNVSWDIYTLRVKEDLSSVAISSDAGTVVLGLQSGIVQVFRKNGIIPPSQKKKPPALPAASLTCMEGVDSTIALPFKRKRFGTCGELAASPQYIDQVCSYNPESFLPAALCPQTCGTNASIELSNATWTGLYMRNGKLKTIRRDCAWLSSRKDSFKNWACNIDASSYIPSDVCCLTCSGANI